jgi:hypothetical protein
MNMKNVIISLTGILMMLSINGNAQEKFTLSGYVKEAESGEVLIGASLFVKELNTGSNSNIYGFYSLTIPTGLYQVKVSFVGFQSKTIEIKLDVNKVLNIELNEEINQLDEVVISSKPTDQNVKSSRMSIYELDMKQLQNIPVIFGEQDLIKTLQLTPGVKPAGEGSCGFYVRGGTIDQNLILLDEAPVYNASHLLGFFSVFNSDAIKNVELIKGGMPANYGGRISSVLDIKMNEGNQKKYSVSGGLGLISSRLTIEGPIIKNRSSFIVSGRRTYTEVLTKLSGIDGLNSIGLYFYDINAKANYIINEKNRVFLSGYFGRDVFNYDNRFGFDWGNKTATLRWNHLFSEKLFLNSSLIYSDYDYVVGMEIASSRLDIKSSIRDINLKEDFQYYINPDNSLKWGFNSIYHTFYPGELSYGNTGMANQLIIEERYALENGIYLLDDLKLWNKVTINYGLRVSNFNLFGPGNYYEFDENGQVVDTSVYQRGEIVKSYFAPEPRVSIAYTIRSKSSIKASFNRNYQYIHLLTKSTSSSPSDLWIPSSNIVKPQYADQFSAGYFRNFNNNSMSFSTELYYKNMYNQIDYKNGADISLNELTESQLIFGKGRAYGLELMFEKKEGKLTGWISYTLSRTERKFDAIDNGGWYPAKQDRTHDVNIVGIYKLSNRLSASATWVFYTGDAVTFPTGKYQIDGYTANYYTGRNGFRMPDYHRLDISLTLEGKKRKRNQSNWNFSIYNVYARKNAYSISFRENPDNPMDTEAVRLSLFTIVPSITYNFKF